MDLFNQNDSYQQLMLQRNIIQPWLNEYYRRSIYKQFMGGVNCPIVMKPAQKGTGDNFVFNIRQVADANVKYNEERIQGTSERLIYAQDTFKIGLARFSTGITGQDMQELKVKHNFTPDLKRDLLDKAEKWLTRRLTNCFGQAFINNAAVNGAANQFIDLDSSFYTEKMLECGIDALNASGEAISRQRVVFGADKGLAVATVGEALADAVLNSAVDDTMNVKHLHHLKKLAKMGSRDNVKFKEPPIAPYKDAQKAGFRAEKHILLTSYACYEKLLDDPKWDDQVKRGVVTSIDQPEGITGGEYVGMYNGIMIFVVPEFSNYVFKNANNTLYGYSVLMGSDAICLGTEVNSQRFIDVTDDAKEIYELVYREISGMKVLKFPSKGNPLLMGTNPIRAELGLIHSFVRLH